MSYNPNNPYGLNFRNNPYITHRLRNPTQLPSKKPEPGPKINPYLTKEQQQAELDKIAKRNESNTYNLSKVRRGIPQPSGPPPKPISHLPVLVRVSNSGDSDDDVEEYSEEVTPNSPPNYSQSNYLRRYVPHVPTPSINRRHVRSAKVYPTSVISKHMKDDNTDILSAKISQKTRRKPLSSRSLSSRSLSSRSLSSRSLSSSSPSSKSSVESLGGKRRTRNRKSNKKTRKSHKK